MTSAIPGNIVGFARLLRAGGIQVGTEQVIAATQAAALTGLRTRQDAHATFFSCLVTHRAHRALFDTLFDLFWRAHGGRHDAMDALLPKTILPPETAPPPAGSRRVNDIFDAAPQDPARAAAQQIEFDASGSADTLEILRAKDFAQMTLAEQNAAAKALAHLNWQLPTRRTRRMRRGQGRQRIDMRATLRLMLRNLGEPAAIGRRGPARIEPPLVALCDISGSMSDYSRMMIHFLHGLTRLRSREGKRVRTFLFGTRLTEVTRAFKHRDIDETFYAVTKLVPDWDGGTRIGQGLKAFNKNWARRVLTQGAHVLLITDGLEREDPELLAAEAARLKRCARGITWANPLLRYDAFAPKAAGIKALLPHVDSMRPVHNLKSIAELSAALSMPIKGGRTR